MRGHSINTSARPEPPLSAILGSHLHPPFGLDWPKHNISVHARDYWYFHRLLVGIAKEKEPTTLFAAKVPGARSFTFIQQWIQRVGRCEKELRSLLVHPHVAIERYLACLLDAHVTRQRGEPVAAAKHERGFWTVTGLGENAQSVTSQPLTKRTALARTHILVNHRHAGFRITLDHIARRHLRNRVRELAKLRCAEALVPHNSHSVGVQRANGKPRAERLFRPAGVPAVGVRGLLTDRPGTVRHAAAHKKRQCVARYLHSPIPFSIGTAPQ